MSYQMAYKFRFYPTEEQRASLAQGERLRELEEAEPLALTLHLGHGMVEARPHDRVQGRVVREDGGQELWRTQ